MIDWWSVSLSGTAAVAALGGSSAAFLQARWSKNAAERAATAAERAAQIGADAQADTAKLTAQLADTSEMERWKRQEIRSLVVRCLEASQSHRRQAEAIFKIHGPVDRDVLVAAQESLTRMELIYIELGILAPALIDGAAYDLVISHFESAKFYRGPLPIPVPRQGKIIEGLISWENNLMRATKVGLGLADPAILTLSHKLIESFVFPAIPPPQAEEAP
jgi:glycosyltransferase A (GT-A) superfamily protein (DUF2064 family)